MLGGLLIGLLATLRWDSNAKFIEAPSASNNDYENFEMALFLEIARDTSSNVIISPYSQKIILGMIKEGAVNETAEEIISALRLPELRDKRWILSTEPYNKGVHIIKSPTIRRSASSDGLKIANRVFLDKSYQVKEDYRLKLNQLYSAEVESVIKEQPKQTAERINQWVKSATAGMIPEIIHESAITRDFSMALSNAIHFKGTWKNEFAKYLTRNECFYGKNGCEMQGMMDMYPDERFYHGYFDDLDAEVIDLPYKDGKHSMVIVLPKQRNGMDQLLQTIDSFTLEDLTSNLKYKKVNVKIPKFTVEYETNMIEIFKSLGIKRAFDTNAQLYNMVDGGGPLKVSNILHKSKIEVDERGSEAAAASIAMVMAYSAMISDPEEPIQFIADHPFLYFIKDEANNALFAGKYVGP